MQVPVDVLDRTRVRGESNEPRQKAQFRDHARARPGLHHRDDEIDPPVLNAIDPQRAVLANLVSRIIGRFQRRNDLGKRPGLFAATGKSFEHQNPYPICPRATLANPQGKVNPVYFALQRKTRYRVPFVMDRNVGGRRLVWAAVAWNKALVELWAVRGALAWRRHPNN